MKDPKLARLDQLLELRIRVNAEIRSIQAELDRRPLKRRSRLVIPECGSETAYQRHIHRREPTDAACRQAHAEHNRRREAS